MAEFGVARNTVRRALALLAEEGLVGTVPGRARVVLTPGLPAATLPAYRQIDSAQEVLLIASDSLYAELHRRSGAQWITEILRGGEAMLNLASVPIDIRLADLYDGIALPDAED